MPIVSPLWIYLIDLVDNLRLFGFPLFIVGGLCLFVGGFLYCEVDTLNGWKWLKTSIVIYAIFVIGTIFIPSSKTLTAMLIAKNITYERVDASKDIIEKVYSDIMNKVGK